MGSNPQPEKMAKITKKTVLITGCSVGGIGAAMAKQFHDQGYHVFATVRSEAKAGSLAGLDGVDILKLDVTVPESVAQCAETVSKVTHSLDILVNNAGSDFVAPLLNVPLHEAKALYDLNVWGILAMTQAFAPLLVKARGVVVNITSIAGILPLTWSGIYSSSKAAAIQMSEVFRVELQPLGVRVVTGVIGAVHTSVHEKAGELVLPPDSYYQQVRDIINEQRQGLKKPGAQDVNVVVKNIIKDVVGGHSGKLWRGGTSTATRYLTWLLPTWLLERVVNGGRGLDKITVNRK